MAKYNTWVLYLPVFTKQRQDMGQIQIVNLFLSKIQKGKLGPIHNKYKPLLFFFLNQYVATKIKSVKTTTKKKGRQAFKDYVIVKLLDKPQFPLKAL